MSRSEVHLNETGSVIQTAVPQHTAENSTAAIGKMFFQVHFTET
jgi:hypothetical protein